MYVKYNKKYHQLFSGSNVWQRSNLGDTPLAPPDNEGKMQLSKNARAFVEASKTEPTSPDPTRGAVYGGLANLLNGIIRPLLTQMQRYQGWPAESWCYNCYDSSQTIKNNLSQAIVNAEARLGSRDPNSVISGPVEPVSVIKETVKELPGAVVQQAQENVAIVEAAIQKAEVAIEEATTAKQEEARIAEEKRQADEAAAAAQAAQDEVARQAAEAKKAELEAQLVAAQKRSEEARLKAEEEDRKLKALGVDLAARKRKKMILIGAATSVVILGLGAYYFWPRLA